MDWWIDIPKSEVIALKQESKEYKEAEAQEAMEIKDEGEMMGGGI